MLLISGLISGVNGIVNELCHFDETLTGKGFQAVG
jgi:hypothetical protein